MTKDQIKKAWKILFPKKTKHQPMGLSHYKNDFDLAFDHLENVKYYVKILRYIIFRYNQVPENVLAKNRTFYLIYNSVIQKLLNDTASLSKKIYSTSDFANNLGFGFIDVLEIEKTNIHWTPENFDSWNNSCEKSSDYYKTKRIESYQKWSTDLYYITKSNGLGVSFKWLRKKYEKEFYKLRINRNHFGHQYDILKRQGPTRSQEEFKLIELFEYVEEIENIYCSFYSVFFPDKCPPTNINDKSVEKEIEKMFGDFWQKSMF